MIATSEAYKAVMNSNVRPKCEPVITVSGIDNNGNQTTLTWRAKDIKDLKYKRGIDPVGRTLPFMELTWTEIYTGKLNAESYPEKYNNVVKYMMVELSFVQNLNFFNAWKDLFSKKVTWKDLFTSGATWKSLKNEIPTETITMPKMFLTARPVIEGSTITWTAKDLISFLDENQIKDFNGLEPDGIPFLNPALYLILNARGGFLNSEQIFDALTETVTINTGNPPKVEYLDKQIIFNSSTKDALKNYACLRNWHWNFKDNVAVAKSFEEYLQEYSSESVYRFSRKVISNYPKVTSGTDVSSYVFKNYVAETDESNAYTKEPSETFQFRNVTLYRYNYNGYGYAPARPIQEINYAVTFNDGPLTVYPINYNGYDNTINGTYEVGEAYIEDNPINPYDSKSVYAKDRFDFLNTYFGHDKSSLEFSGLANPAIEPGDIVEIETNLYSNNDEQITKTAMVIEFEISYDGSIKENIIAHEVKVP